MESKDIKPFIFEHILNKCPEHVWNVEWKYRKHITTADIDPTSPKMVMSYSEIQFIESTRRPAYPTLESWKSSQLKRVFTKTGKYNNECISRESKKRNPHTREWVRKFSLGLILIDHCVVVTTDPLDENIVGIEYIRDRPCFSDTP